MRSATETMDQSETVDHNALGASFARLQMLGYGKRVEQLKSPSRDRIPTDPRCVRNSIPQDNPWDSPFSLTVAPREPDVNEALIQHDDKLVHRTPKRAT